MTGWSFKQKATINQHWKLKQRHKQGSGKACVVYKLQNVQRTLTFQGSEQPLNDDGSMQESNRLVLKL